MKGHISITFKQREDTEFIYSTYCVYTRVIVNNISQRKNTKIVHFSKTEEITFCTHGIMVQFKIPGRK